MNPDLLKDQPANVERVLTDFLSTLSKVLDQSLKSAILYGSAAEGRLRPASDVNLLIIVEDCPPSVLARLQPSRSAAVLDGARIAT